MVHHPFDRPPEGVSVAGGHEARHVAVLTDFFGAIDIIDDHGHATEKRLGHGPGKTLPVARMRQGIHGLEVPGDGIRPDQAGVQHTPGQSHLAHAPKQAIPPPPVADPQQLHARALLHERAECIEQVVVALELGEAGDRAHDEVVFFEAQLPAHPGSRRGGLQVPLDLHPRVDGDILLPAADAGGQGLLPHGVGDADEPVTPPGGDALGENEKRVGEP